MLYYTLFGGPGLVNRCRWTMVYSWYCLAGDMRFSARRAGPFFDIWILSRRPSCNLCE